MAKRQTPITPHRPSRESVRGKELAEAKQQVRRLEREVARLRRRLERYETPEETAAADLGEPTTLAEANSSDGQGADPNDSGSHVTDSGACPCGSNDFAEVLTPGGKVLRICKSCKVRKVVPL